MKCEMTGRECAGSNRFGCFECGQAALSCSTQSAGSVSFGDVARAEKRGRDDFADGVVVGDNPYPETHRLFWHWMKGWVNAGMMMEYYFHAPCVD